MSRKRLIISIVLTILTLLLLFFIFYHSSMNADDSGQESTGVMEFINDFFKKLGLGISFTDHIVRKIAHFTEYFVLGALLCCTAFSYTLKLKVSLIFSPIFGLITAVLDELSQKLSVGRSAQVSDVILDFCGVLTAAIVTGFFIYMIFQRRNKRKKEPN